MMLAAVSILILSVTCLANPLSDDEYFQKYISDIQSQIDKTVKPCDNFGKYACGNLKPSKASGMIQYMQYIRLLLDKNLNDYEPENKAEKLIKTFYLSCKNHADITKIFEQIDVLKSVKVWPVNRDFSDKEIAELLGYFTTFDYPGLLTIDTIDLIQNNIITIRMKTDNNPDSAITMLNKFGVPSGKSVKNIEKLTNFIYELQNISKLVNNKQNYEELNNVAALKVAIPNFDWDTYFTTFVNVYGLHKNIFLEQAVKIENVEKLKKIIDLINETDSKIVTDYIIWGYLKMSSDLECVRIVAVLYPFLPFKFIEKQSYNPETFLLKELQVFNHFEKSFSQIKSQLNNPESKSLNVLLSGKRMVYENLDKYISGQYLIDLFSDFEMNEQAFYLNFFNIFHAVNKIIIIKRDERSFEMLSDIIRSLARNYIQMQDISSSSTYNFITTNTHLWTDVFYLDNIIVNRTISEECFPYENKTANYKNVDYLNYHAGYHVALHDYLNYANENKNQLKQETDILTEAGLNNAKMYMLSIAQQRCFVSNNKDLNDDHFLWYLKHSKDFSETWDCSAGDKMNDICDDSTFVPHF